MSKDEAAAQGGGPRMTIRKETIHLVRTALTASKAVIEELQRTYQIRAEFILDEIDAALLAIETDLRGV